LPSQWQHEAGRSSSTMTVLFARGIVLKSRFGAFRRRNRVSDRTYTLFL